MRRTAVSLALALSISAAACSASSDATVGLTAQISRIRAAVASGNTSEAVALLRRLDGDVDRLVAIGSIDRARALAIHRAVGGVLTALRADLSSSSPSAVPTTPAPSPADHGNAFGHGHHENGNHRDGNQGNGNGEGD